MRGGTRPRLVRDVPEPRDGSAHWRGLLRNSAVAATARRIAARRRHRRPAEPEARRSCCVVADRTAGEAGISHNPWPPRRGVHHREGHWLDQTAPADHPAWFAARDRCIAERLASFRFLTLPM